MGCEWLFEWCEEMAWTVEGGVGCGWVGGRGGHGAEEGGGWRGGEEESGRG